MSFILAISSIERGDQPVVEREPACHHHHALGRADRLQQLGQTTGHRQVNAFQNVGSRDAARDHVDHVGLGQHGTDAADDLGIIGLARQRTDLVLRDSEITCDVFEELPRTRCALAGHLVAQDLAALVDADRASMQRADVERRPRFRIEIDCAARVRGHRVEMPGVERHALAFTGGRHVVDVLFRELGLLQGLIEDGTGELDRIALADAQCRCARAISPRRFRP